ncbi:multicopper oxidase, putative [Talaromyces stipitatus ATCC 10500]|uniref:Multicopper oxidase, putative n=1 Tax=Talaromyces stipitatus (strain ATCC 10500 / CBS 375.48 / QM 6759 / NRRL 1006) TaxID=441959 RepID=B8LZ21_TALSN|nr:multicopper oxidase, putative [Talaromyces stipitatus ATCC 10500]EED21065.1 multicopper oxidase, putative [Talaromyces stipitatus ATCC 10500]
MYLDYDRVESSIFFLFAFLANLLPWSTPKPVPFAIQEPISTQSPSTREIRKYNFTIKRGIFPGPLIEANYGDTISVTVHNEIEDPEEGTALHWHGILQKGTPWFDGVPGVTQCPIAPGKSLEYTFKAEPYGTSWYHAHYSAQYANGIFGAMVIHDPKHVNYDIDMGPVLLTDYFHRYYRDVVLEVLRPRPFPAAPPSDLNLINAKGDWRCTDSLGSAPSPDTHNLTEFRLEPGKKHLLRLINAGAEGMQRFSVDNFTLEVIANDFTPLQPYNTNVVTLAVGQRVDGVLTVPEDHVEPVWVRSYISDLCSFTNHHSAHAVAYFTDDIIDVMPSTSGHPIDDSDCGGYYQTFLSHCRRKRAQSFQGARDWKYYERHRTMGLAYEWLRRRSGPNESSVVSCQQRRAKLRHQWNVFDTGKARTIRVFLKNPIDFPHPMHIHGHNVKILAEGVGEWDGTIVNPSNPNRRDTQMIRSLGYMVFEIDDVDNAGLWPFHCHIGPHLSAGFSVTLMRDPDQLAKMTVPYSIKQTCVDWIALKDRVPDQIDSGLQVDAFETEKI